MMTFWVISVLLLLIALLFVVIPLWRGSRKKDTVQRDVANLEIFRDQLSEMDADLQNGLLSREMYEQGKQELQSRLLSEVEQSHETQTAVVSGQVKILSLLIIILLPLVAIGVYWKTGNQQALLQLEKSANVNNLNSAHTPAELATLEEKVAADPKDANSWFVLANSYSDMGRYTDAVSAYDKLTQLVPNEAQLWADYADVQAMAAGKTLIGKPTQLLDKALELDPANFKALALAGSAAMERKDYALTVRYWERLLKMLPKDDQNSNIVASGIQQARVLMVQKNGVKLPMQSQQSSADNKPSSHITGKEAISGTVKLSDAFKGKANPEDTVFVLVRAASGPKMPLAILRKQVRDLPLRFELDDSTSMSPQMKLSNFDQVVVIARISKTGNAMTQPGDLQGMSATIKPGIKGLNLKIDQIVP